MYRDRERCWRRLRIGQVIIPPDAGLSRYSYRVNSLSINLFGFKACQYQNRLRFVLKSRNSGWYIIMYERKRSINLFTTFYFFAKWTKAFNKLLYKNMLITNAFIKVSIYWTQWRSILFWLCIRINIIINGGESSHSLPKLIARVESWPGSRVNSQQRYPEWNEHTFFIWY